MRLLCRVRCLLVAHHGRHRFHSVVLLLQIEQESPEYNCRLHEAEAAAQLTNCKLDSGLDQWAGYGENVAVHSQCAQTSAYSPMRLAYIGMQL